MLYDTRLGIVAAVLAGFFAIFALAADSSTAAHNAWSVAYCFAVATLANIIVPWFGERADRKTGEAGSAREA